MSKIPKQDVNLGSPRKVCALDMKECPERNSAKEVELSDSCGLEEPLDYVDSTVEQLVEKWKQRSEERDCRYASIMLQSEKILAELTNISKQIKQIQIGLDDEADSEQAVENQADNNQAVDEQADDDQAVEIQSDDDQAVVSDPSDANYFDNFLFDQDDDDTADSDADQDSWDAEQLFGYQGNAGEGDSDQEDASNDDSSVAPEYLKF